MIKFYVESGQQLLRVALGKTSFRNDDFIDLPYPKKSEGKIFLVLNFY